MRDRSKVVLPAHHRYFFPNSKGKGSIYVGLFSFLKLIFGGSDEGRPGYVQEKGTRRQSQEQTPKRNDFVRPNTKTAGQLQSTTQRKKRKKSKPFTPYPTSFWAIHRKKKKIDLPISDTKPYAGARPMSTGGWMNRAVGGDPGRLQSFNVPIFNAPQDIADWAGIPLKALAWLADCNDAMAWEWRDKKNLWHYHFHWVAKKSGGVRLIEAPKPLLKTVQKRILSDILSRITPHPAAHGFVKGRSIKTNVEAHCGNYVVFKFDLEQFYPSVGFNRVTAIFRSVGYNVECARWLARLCTSKTPGSVCSKLPWRELHQYSKRHLPQGAPTSPALANLSAYSLDVRLSGLAKKFKVNYTRYADDLTFSGPETLMKGKTPAIFTSYVRGIVRSERFKSKRSKQKVVREGNRQIVTGLTVNKIPNVSRKEFDRLKAVLFNCIHKGVENQNVERRPDFQSYLQGKIAFVRQINANKADKLDRLYKRIRWA